MGSYIGTLARFTPPASLIQTPNLGYNNDKYSVISHSVEDCECEGRERKDEASLQLVGAGFVFP